MDTTTYQEIAELQEQLTIVHRDYCDAEEFSEREEELWRDFSSREQEIAYLYDSVKRNAVLIKSVRLVED